MNGPVLSPAKIDKSRNASARTGLVLQRNGMSFRCPPTKKTGRELA